MIRELQKTSMDMSVYETAGSMAANAYDTVSEYVFGDDGPAGGTVSAASVEELIRLGYFTREEAVAEGLPTHTITERVSAQLFPGGSSRVGNVVLAVGIGAAAGYILQRWLK